MFVKVCEQFKIDSIYNTGYDRTFAKSYAFDGEAHDFWESVYVVSGKIEVIENDEIYIMGEGDIIFHAPMEFHRLKAASDTSPHVFNLSFKTVGEIPSRLTRGVFHLSPEQNKTYLELIEFIKEYIFADGEKNASRVREAAYKLCLFIEDTCRSAENTKTVFSDTGALVYKALVKMMNDSICLNLTIDDFAKKSFISVSYLKLLFRRYAGITPKTYYNNLRIIYAKNLIMSGKSVSDTAELMNFSSHNQFIRFFKNAVGTTPLSYRKTIGENQNRSE